ncbi:MAG: hypothetical protein PVG27_13230 [Chloroflexota bacterium]|jgi:hypothetical protein
MDDMQAIEQRISREMLRRAGPSEPVDDLAVFESVIAANRSQGWGFTMFSALKFVAAAAIVTLFGGFLLAGILTPPQDGEVVPAAVTESPEPTTTADLLSGMVTEEVEPGVYRVVNDGVRELQPLEAMRIKAGQDGSVWVESFAEYDEGLIRLGDKGTLDLQLELWDLGVEDFEVASDATVWAVMGSEEEAALRSNDGQAWTTHRVIDRSSDLDFGDVEIASDDVVWAYLEDGIGYLAGDGTTWHDADWPVARQPSRYHSPWYSPIGTEAWVADEQDLWHYADGQWRQIDHGDLGAGALPGGAVWDRRLSDEPLYLYRHDATGWRRWDLAEQGMRPAGWHWGTYDVAPDGSYWAGWSVQGNPEEGRPRCEGVSRFDGLTWERHLPGKCIDDMDIAPDGSVWVIADDQEGKDLYAITPEAVAATG